MYRGAVNDSVKDDIAVRERVLVDDSQSAPEHRPAQRFLVACFGFGFWGWYRGCRIFLQVAPEDRPASGLFVASSVFGVWGLLFVVCCLGFRVWNFWVTGVGCRV